MHGTINTDATGTFVWKVIMIFPEVLNNYITTGKEFISVSTDVIKNSE